MPSMSLSWQGDYRATKRWMDKMEAGSVADVLRSCGEKGIEALSAATPVRTGKTAASWGFPALPEAGVGPGAAGWRAFTETAAPAALVAAHGGLEVLP